MKSDSTDSNSKHQQAEPTPETLEVQSDEKLDASKAADYSNSLAAKISMRRHGVYQPSHKATFIGLSVVVGILLINATIIFIVIRSQTSGDSGSNKQAEVTISSDVLDSLGVSHNTVGSTGAELVVNPNATFNGGVVLNGDVSASGNLNLNNKLIGVDASFNTLQAETATFSGLNVNNDATISNLNLRKNLTVVGSTLLQGPATIDQLLTVNNNVNIIGSLSVGGTLSTRNFQASSLVSDTTLTIGGHVITGGNAPGCSKGEALYSTDTVSVSGNDAAGTVNVNLGSGSRSGIVAYISFTNNYSNIPHVVVTAVGPGAADVYVNRTSSGFNIGVGSISGNGAHYFDYIVMQ